MLDRRQKLHHRVVVCICLCLAENSVRPTAHAPVSLMSPMSDDELKLLVSTALNGLLTSSSILAPLTSVQLLAKIMSFKTPNGLFASKRPPRLRLTDLSRFEIVLESFSKTWDQGHIELLREDDQLIVAELSLGNSYAPQTSTTSSRKRKRIVDEDADSAAGDEGTESASDDVAPSHPHALLSGLNREYREVYALLQKGTTKGRLLAEQV